jgi:hypothetical protein
MSAPSGLNEMEQQVMDLLLQGDHPLLATLREQFVVADVSRREYTGAGFFTNFAIPATAPRLPFKRRLVFCDVYADLTGLEHGAGFLLFIDDGTLNFLECSICEPEWPTDAKLVRAYYMHAKRPSDPSLVKTKERDLRWLLQHVAPS